MVRDIRTDIQFLYVLSKIVLWPLPSPRACLWNAIQNVVKASGGNGGQCLKDNCDLSHIYVQWSPFTDEKIDATEDGEKQDAQQQPQQQPPLQQPTHQQQQQQQPPKSKKELEAEEAKRRMNEKRKEERERREKEAEAERIRLEEEK